jgi:hypothetical protein
LASAGNFDPYGEFSTLHSTLVGNKFYSLEELRVEQMVSAPRGKLHHKESKFLPMEDIM